MYSWWACFAFQHGTAHRKYFFVENTFSTSACDAGATGLAPHEQEVETFACCWIQQVRLAVWICLTAVGKQLLDCDRIWHWTAKPCRHYLVSLPFSHTKQHAWLTCSIINKKAVLSQRWPRDACYISRSWAVVEIWPFEIIQDGGGG